jgi:hypothetical protein
MTPWKVSLFLVNTAKFTKAYFVVEFFLPWVADTFPATAGLKRADPLHPPVPIGWELRAWAMAPRKGRRPVFGKSVLPACSEG